MYCRQRLMSVALFAFLSLPIAASADDKRLNTRVLNAPNAPLFLQRCRATQSAYNGTVFSFYSVVVNRSHHDALTYTTEYKAYDREGTLLGQTRFAKTFDNPLTASDPQMITSQTAFPLSEEPTAVAYVSCKIMNASFTGRREWSAGQHWPESLQAIPSVPQDSSANDGPDTSKDMHADNNGGTTAARPTIAVGTLLKSILGVK
jgi:hypothetical protein